MPLQIRRGTTAQRLSITPLPGELIYDTNLQTVFVGDGFTSGGISALTGITLEDARDAVGQMLVDGVHKNINFNYGPFQDAANRIDVELDLQNYDGEISAAALRGPLFADDSSLIVDSSSKNISANNITANSISVDTLSLSTFTVSDFKGSVFADDSTLLVDAVSGSINLNGTVKGNIIPDANETYDIGSVSNRFKDLYLSGSSLFLGSAQITATGSVVNLPAGSTVGGIGIGSGSGTGDFSFRVAADDSTQILVTNNNTVQFLGGQNIETSINGDGVVTIQTTSGNLSANQITTSFLKSSDSSAITIDSPVTMSTNCVVDENLTVLGNILGSVRATDNSVFMIDSVNKFINLNGTINGNVLPHQNELYDLGSNTFRFRDLYLSGDAFLTGNTPRTLAINNFTSDNTGSVISFNKSRGTILSPSTVNIGDRLGNILFRGYNGSIEQTAAAITSSIDSVVSPTNIPGNLEFNVRNTFGVLLTPLRILNSGIIRIQSDTNQNSTKIILASCHHDSASTTTSIGLSRSRGSIASPAAVQTNDLIYNITYAGYDGVAYRDSSQIRAVIDGTVSTSIVPGRLEFWTTNSSGTLTKNAQLDKNGVFKVDNIQALNNTLSIVGDIIGSVYSDSSTLLIDGTDGSIKYYPSVPGDWSGTAPTTVGEALDRLATLVKTLNSGVGA